MCSQKYILQMRVENFLYQKCREDHLYKMIDPDYKKTEKTINYGMKLELFLYIFQLGIGNIILL
jgi:hypothetical protein